nr:MAG TPA: homing endonuclease [Caudoviricetes sp.]
MKPTDNGNGYFIISLRKCHKRKNFYIHRLVAQHFIDNPNDLNVVNHKDYNTKNNKASNLEWVTQKENVQYSTERMKKPKSVTHSNTKEKYISYRKEKGKYRVTINRKEYGAFNTLEEAIEKRDNILRGTYEKIINTAR